MVAAFAVPADAGAADRIYWTTTSDEILSANLDGSGDREAIDTTGAAVAESYALALDPASNSVYWANSAGSIGRANLDGTGNGSYLDTTGATVAGPLGVTFDRATNSIYWTNMSGAIARANLDGTGDGSDLDTTGASLAVPTGIVVDPATNSIYWGNALGGLSRANLDGTGDGSDLDTTGATSEGAAGIAIDPETNSIYWANDLGGLSRANLDGTGDGSDLDTTGATVDAPFGIAIDPETNSIYWANFGDTGGISRANLDGTGGGADIPIGDPPTNPVGIALLKAPVGAGLPVVTGGGRLGDTLSCSAGVWAANLTGASLFREPTSLAYQWTLNGGDIPSATSATFTPTVAGDYRCEVTATNPAGSTPQTSSPTSVIADAQNQVPPPTPGPPLLPTSPSNKVTFGKVKVSKRRCTATLSVRVPGPGRLQLSGNRLRKASETVQRKRTVRLRIVPTGKAKRKLRRQGRLRTTVRISFTPTGGIRATRTKSLTLRCGASRAVS